jgi:hypothetical protein
MALIDLYPRTLPWTTAKIPANVEKLMVFYSNPTEENLKRATQPEPQGRRSFKFEGATKLWSSMRIDTALHTDIDSDPTVQSMIFNQMLSEMASHTY